MRSPDSRKWAFTFMPSTSVPTRVSRSTSLNRPSGVASIWQWSGSAAGSSSWMELVSARPMVTMPPSNSKVRSSLSERQMVSLGIGSPHSRRWEGETEGGIGSGDAGALQRVLEHRPLGPAGGSQAQRLLEIARGLGLATQFQQRHAAPGVGIGPVGLEPERLAEIRDGAGEIPLDPAQRGAVDQGLGVL